MGVGGMQFVALLWKDWLVFKSRIVSITLGSVIGPLLYLIAFGWGIGGVLRIGGMSYGAFVVPGIIAMNSMINSFNFIANDINLSRIYTKTFEALMISPTPMAVFTAARVSAGALRGLYSALLILGISFLFQNDLRPDWYFFLVLVLNCAVFAAIGFIAGLLIDSHGDMAKISNFVITPMSFLCGTFFPLEKLPAFLRGILSVLPLTQTVRGLRGGLSAGGSWVVPLVLGAYLLILLPLGAFLCGRTE
jgi:ABC-type multidrug transport system permease subunit